MLTHNLLKHGLISTSRASKENIEFLIPVDSIFTALEGMYRLAETVISLIREELLDLRLKHNFAFFLAFLFSLFVVRLCSCSTDICSGTVHVKQSRSIKVRVSMQFNGCIDRDSSRSHRYGSPAQSRSVRFQSTSTPSGTTPATPTEKTAPSLPPGSTVIKGSK